MQEQATRICVSLFRNPLSQHDDYMRANIVLQQHSLSVSLVLYNIDCVVNKKNVFLHDIKPTTYLIT